MRFPALAAALAFVPSSLTAQGSAPARPLDSASARAVGTITDSDIRRRIGIIADDSMGGRDTPSRGLDLTARYIAGEFARFGLAPGGDSGQFEQRYAIAKSRLDGDASNATFSSGGVRAVAGARRDFIYVFGPRTGRPIKAPVVLVSGPLLVDSAKVLPIQGKTLVVVTDSRAPNATPVNQFLAPVFERGPAAVIVVLNNDTTTLARQVANQFRERTMIEGETADDPVVTMVHERVLGDVFRTAGLDLATLRASTRYEARPLPALDVSVTVANLGKGAITAPNVVGILEGSDPILKREYIVFSAHMDHVGINPNAKGDSIWNGADDDASGTAGVIELAEAFSQPGARPRRSLIFVTVSGEEKGLWGSEYFASHMPVPVDQVVANLNMDMIGRNWRDTIAVIGKEHSDLGATLARVNAEHPELQMHAIDDIWPNENFYFRSDHYNFARRGIPILFFFNGTHKDYHQASDSPDKIDAEKEARIVKLVYYLGEAIANASERPKWNEESRKKIVTAK
ncbi:MAG: M20/M25/M40 family metallo-hydrolase [Gemmatimonadaceae bacterium]